MIGEIQTMIDECGDGTWEGVVLVGSNYDFRTNAPTFRAVAELVAQHVAVLLALRVIGTSGWCECDTCRAGRA